MNKQKLNKEQFSKVIASIESKVSFDVDFMYEVYDVSFSAICDLVDKNVLTPATYINSFNIINYIIGEYSYALENRSEEEKKSFLTNENTILMMASVVSDKYTTMDFFPSKEKGLSNKYLPPISSLDTYLNFMLNLLNRGEKNNPKYTLVKDLMHKTISIARCVLNLLVSGFETEAMALWRTLHECECILKLLSENDETVINAYLKHMNYTIAYRNGLGSKEDTDKIFVQIKEEMSKHDLKSKDIKKFILAAIRHNLLSVTTDNDGNTIYYICDPETSPFTLLIGYSHTDNFGPWCAYTIECGGTPVYIALLPTAHKQLKDKLSRDIIEIATRCTNKIIYQEKIAHKNGFLRALPKQYTC